MAEKAPHQIALERILIAARTGAFTLDLSELSLDALPPELWKLTQLTRLNLSNNNLSELPSNIMQLTDLTDLDVSSNTITNLPDELWQLSQLELLNLSSNPYSEQLQNDIFDLKHLRELSLSNLQLDSIPDKIWQLSQLTDLDLSKNKLSELPLTIGKLTQLKHLDLSNNILNGIPATIGNLLQLESVDLSSNYLFTLPEEFWQLSQLEHLILDSNPIKLSEEIGRLVGLKYFSINNGYADSDITSILSEDELYIQNIPDEIGNLVQLQTLDLSSNKVRELPAGIVRLTQLSSLYLYDNQIKTFPNEICQLTQLVSLDLSDNEIPFLPYEILQLSDITHLNLQNNPIPIPPEILEKVDEPKSILYYYFSIKGKEPNKDKTTKVNEAAEGSVQSVEKLTPLPLNESKILIVGQGSVGKTSIVERIMHNKFNLDESKTEGISISRWEVNDQDLKILPKNNYIPLAKISLNVWDFGGQEIMHATHQFFLTKRSLYLLVLDSRLTQEENRVEYWLKIIQSFGGESPALIVGNKIDQHPLDIDRTGLQKKYPNIVGILETSAATGAGIEELKAAIAEQVNNLPHVRDLLPETWFTVKTKLEGLGRESNFITHDKYLELCAENEVSDETSQRTLIGFLHDLGVVLHFQDDPRLEALGILNPQWVTNGVYKILNSHTLFQNKGVLTTSMLDEILNLPEYPRGKRLFIVDMMKKFELCYDIEPDKTFLVPDLLPKDEPAELNFNGVPAFEYAYPVLPSSVFTRFIVRMNQKIDDGLVWRTGVVLKIGENIALVKADIEDRKITIAIDGLEHTRRDALSAIRFQLDEIHGSIKGLNPEKYVPVPGALDADPLEYETLLMMEREGIETTHVKSRRKLVAINVSQMLNGVESEYQRRQYGNVININGNVTGSTLIAGDENEIKG